MTSLNDWENPRVFGINKERPHVSEVDSAKGIVTTADWTKIPQRL